MCIYATLAPLPAKEATVPPRWCHCSNNALCSLSLAPLFVFSLLFLSILRLSSTPPNCASHTWRRTGRYTKKKSAITTGGTHLLALGTGHGGGASEASGSVIQKEKKNIININLNTPKKVG